MRAAIKALTLTVIVVLADASTGVGQQLPATPQFPYEAEVIADDVYVRSGPGMNYYPTGKLGRGDRVSVRRHDFGGWYAVEPPTGSFSWVSGQYVEEAGNGEGTITGDSVQVRIGSFQSDVRNVLAGVELYRNDRVRILEKKVYPDAAGGTVWYRIQPVRGEERWITGQYVRPVMGSPAVEDRPIAPPDQPAAPEPNRSDIIQTRPEPEPVRGAPEKPAIGNADTRGQQTQARESRDAPRSPEAQPPQEDSAWPLIEQADHMLAKTTPQDVVLWELGPVRSLYERAVRMALEPAARAAAQDGLARLEYYEAVQRHHQQFQAVRARTAYRDRTLQAEYQQLEGELPAPVPRYDGTGYLTRTAVQGIGAPPYALTDPDGRVRYYVSPAIGVDLRPHLDRRVAVIGSVSYRSDVHAHHITVRSVVPLDVQPSGLANGAPSDQAR